MFGVIDDNGNIPIVLRSLFFDIHIILIVFPLSLFHVFEQFPLSVLVSRHSLLFLLDVLASFRGTERTLVSGPLAAILLIGTTALPTP